MRARCWGKAMIGLLLGLLQAPAAGSADVIRLRADAWCPFNCEPAARQPGYMVEILAEVFRAAGHEIDYRTLNWSRSIEETRRGLYEAVLGAVPDEAPDFLFSQPLGVTQDVYAMRRGERLASTGDPFAGRVVGGVAGYGYSGPIADFIAAHGQDPSRVQLLAGDDALIRNLRKLAAGRVDVIVDDRNRVQSTIGTLGLADRIEIVWRSAAEPVYVAFSPAAPKAALYKRLVDEGVQRLRASGRLAELLRRYNLTDWAGAEIQ